MIDVTGRYDRRGDGDGLEHGMRKQKGERQNNHRRAGLRDADDASLRGEKRRPQLKKRALKAEQQVEGAERKKGRSRSSCDHPTVIPQKWKVPIWKTGTSSHVTATWKLPSAGQVCGSLHLPLESVQVGPPEQRHRT